MRERVSVGEKLYCSPLSAMKMKHVSEKTKSQHQHYSKTDAKRATSEWILLNTKNQLAILTTTKKL